MQKRHSGEWAEDGSSNQQQRHARYSFSWLPCPSFSLVYSNNVSLSLYTGRQCGSFFLPRARAHLLLLAAAAARAARPDESRAPLKMLLGRLVCGCALAGFSRNYARGGPESTRGFGGFVTSNKDELFRRLAAN